MNPNKVLLVIDNYEIKSTGADGGRCYISTEIEYNGKLRKLTILFASKSDEKRLAKVGRIKVEGDLQNDGEKVDLIITNATLVN